MPSIAALSPNTVESGIKIPCRSKTIHPIPTRYQPITVVCLLSTYRFSGRMSLMRIVCAAMSSRLWERCTRFVEAGLSATESPSRHSVEGRMGRGTKPPPQLGQTLWSLVSTQSTQKVHSYEQIRASGEEGGRSLSQYSQLGLSSKAIATAPPERMMTFGGGTDAIALPSPQQGRPQPDHLECRGR